MQRSMKVAIIGGGMAGLGFASAFAKLARAAQATGFAGVKSSGFIKDGIFKLTVFDKASKPGLGGASAVSSGLVHPFASKKGLLHKGIEGYEATLSLMQMIGMTTDTAASPSRDDSVENMGKIMRLCYTQEEYDNWRKFESSRPDLVQTLTEEEAERFIIKQNSDCGVAQKERATESAAVNIFGAVHLRMGFTVSSKLYLEHLWKFVQESSLSNGNKTGSFSCEWIQRDFTQSSQALLDIDKEFDVVVIACGAGLCDLWPGLKTLSESETTHDRSKHQLPSFSALPFKFVKGRNYLYSTTTSTLDSESNLHAQAEFDSSQNIRTTFLNGKYIVPFNRHPWHHFEEQKVSETENSKGVCKSYFVVGSTHEHVQDPDLLSSDNRSATVLIENKDKVSSDIEFLKRLHVMNSDLMTELSLQLEGSISAVRVVSKRCGLGRLPKVGRLFHDKYYVMTGLGSRGMIYHALIADMLLKEIILQRTGYGGDGDRVGDGDECNIPEEFRFKFDPPRQSKQK